MLSIKEFFQQFKTIVIIGASSNPYRTSYHIAEYLQQNDYHIIPVNPNEKQVLGETSYDSVFDLPEETEADAVVIFRNKIYTSEMVKQIIEWSGEKDGKKPVIWTQLDVSTSEAKELAENAGYPYVENRCMMVEHRSLS